MSAQVETFLEIKKVVDHNCGNYRIGEIDYYPLECVRAYINQHGEYGLLQLSHVFNSLMSEAHKELVRKNNLDSGVGQGSIYAGSNQLKQRMMDG